MCRCSPSNGVVYLQARLLRDIVNKEIRKVSCASTCPRKAQKGLLLGDLCREAGHLMWALKVWKFTLREIHTKDYDDWIDVSFHTEHVRLRDVISDGVCEVIGRRIDEVERRLGLSNACGRYSWAYRAGDGWYDMLWAEKYDYEWEDTREYWIRFFKESRERQQREQLFLEAQLEHLPQPQDFFGYWNDYSPALHEDLDVKIDDWD